MSDISSNDKNYRRGLVLGLSLAELFIILLFLLLLATVGFVSMLEEKQRAQQEEINSLKSELQAIEKIFGKRCECKNKEVHHFVSFGDELLYVSILVKV